MMMTLKQIADELGVEKQRVYRAVKQNHITETVQSGQTKMYDEAVQATIKAIFSEQKPPQVKQVEAHQDVHQDAAFDVLLKQLEVKDQQIAALQQQVTQLTAAIENTSTALQAAQALHAGTMQKQLTETDNKDKVSLGERMKRWFSE